MRLLGSYVITWAMHDECKNGVRGMTGSLRCNVSNGSFAR
jgi:hypothetical protein